MKKVIKAMITIDGINLAEIIEMCRYVNSSTTDFIAFVRFTKTQYGEDASFENFIDHCFEYNSNFGPNSIAAFAILFGVYLRNEAKKFDLTFYQDGSEHLFSDKVEAIFEKRRRDFIKRGDNYFSEYVMDILRWYREVNDFELKKKILYEITRYFQIFKRHASHRHLRYDSNVKVYKRNQLLENDL
jgi:hypothetical protein